MSNIPKEAVKYRLSKKLGVWVRTWFSYDIVDDKTKLVQHNAFSKDRNLAWDKWNKKP